MLPPNGRAAAQSDLVAHPARASRDYEREGLWAVSLGLGRERHTATTPDFNAFAQILADALPLAGARGQTRYGAVVYDFISVEILHRLP